MKNPNRSGSIQKTERTDNRNGFNEWYNTSILKTVTEEMQFAHKIIDEEFSTKLLIFQNSLDDTIEKLRAVKMLADLYSSSSSDDDMPF